MPVVDTIVAQASPPGRSAAALVRLSGPATRDVLERVGACEPQAFVRGCRRARVRLTAEDASQPPLVLPVLLMTFVAPASYTGEDAAELLVPGNPDVVRRVIEALTAQSGVRVAGPGEFSARAYLAGKLSLEQAEGVAATIAARSREEFDAARDLLSGARGAHYAMLADRLATLLALTEAGIDFTDQEDVVAIAPRDLAQGIDGLIAAIAAEIGGPAAEEAKDAMPQVVLAGAPNAGKSTLFNALLGRTRAVVSDEAGTTRDVLAETLTLDSGTAVGHSVSLCDLAGIDAGLAVSKLDARARGLAAAEIARADVVIHCDPTGAFVPLGVRDGAHVIRVRTKGDLARGSTPARDAIEVCALDGWGLNTLRRAIADGAWGASPAGGTFVVPRHRLALRRACDALESAREAIGEQREAHGLSNPETVASGLRIALDALEELAGRITPDDVLGRVFATFCVGK
ncbi:MAG: GTPase [Planctomycetota bacterium]|nr:GTPase [Planctomycetota bacterium]